MLRAAVIGAGVSGCACARALTDAGAFVVVLEKSRGAGGRSSTRRRSGISFDHGAQYLTARDPLIIRLIDGLRGAGQVAEWPGGLVELEGGVVVPFENGAARWVGVPGMSALSRRLLDGIDLMTGIRVERLTRAGDGWHLDDGSGGRWGPFDVVLLATPAPQAAALAGEATSLSEYAARVRMSPCWAGMFAFAGATRGSFDGAFVRSGPLVWAARNSSKPARSQQPEAWVVHATAAWSAAHLEMSEAEAGRLLLEAFREATGLETGPPIHIEAHRWRLAFPEVESLDGVRGRGRGVGAITGGTGPGTHLYDPEQRIGFCGDWFSGGDIESAMLSGLGLAERILQESRSQT